MTLRPFAPALAAALSLASLPLRAETPPTVELDPVIVTATRSPQAGNRLPALLTVITRRDLELGGAQSLAEALRGVPGVQVTDFYGDGSQYSTVDMRGFGLAAQANTLILVDGRRLNNVDIAPPDLSSIALKDVERIEIVQGSAGTLYGDQAVGGVINIVTRTPDAFSLEGMVGVGSHGGRRAEVQLGQRVDALALRLTAGARDADNYREGNHHDNGNVLGRAGWDYDGGALYVEGGYVRDRIQLPGPLDAAEMERDPRQCEPSYCGNYSHSATAFQRLHWQHALRPEWAFESDLTHRLTQASSELTLFGTPSRFTQSRKQWSLNPRLAGRVPVSAGAVLVTAGIDAQVGDYELISAFGRQTDRQRQRDLYAQAIVPLAPTVEATVGGRLARVDDELYDGFAFPVTSPRHATARSWEAGLAWMPAPSLRLHARHDGNFRFAKADEYFSFSNLFPAPAPDDVELDPQTGHTYELGAAWTTEAWRLRAGLYRLELENEISFDPGTFTNLNLDRTRRQGATLDARWSLAPALELSAGGQYLRARFTDGPNDGHDVPLVARRTGRAAATAFLPLGFSGTLEVIAVGRRPFDGDYANSAGALPGYELANLGVQHRRGRWRTELRANNLLDRRYADYGALDFTSTPTFFPAPELNFWLNVAASLY